MIFTPITYILNGTYEWLLSIHCWQHYTWRMSHATHCAVAANSSVAFIYLSIYLWLSCWAVSTRVDTQTIAKHSVILHFLLDNQFVAGEKKRSVVIIASWMSAGMLHLRITYPNYIDSLPNTLHNSAACGIYSCYNNTTDSQETQHKYTSDLQVTH